MTKNEIEPDIPRDVIDQKPVKQKLAKFNYKDALNLEKLLTEEEIMVRDQFHDYCQDKLMPRILMANRDEGMYLPFNAYGLCPRGGGWYSHVMGML